MSLYPEGHAPLHTRKELTMPETTQASARTFTLADCIRHMEKTGKIAPPFSQALQEQ